ncbi:putative Cap [Circoviridae TM-6c]|uniref:Putative Cap n=1 Tax=Circoviridae TM-6c TaxID=795382 RepID=D9IZ83_9VIRU|nr:putative Cap [Circoviridae TM-6c]
MALKRFFRRKRVYRRKRRMFRRKGRIPRVVGGRSTGIQFFKLRTQTSVTINATGPNALKGMRAQITDDPKLLGHDQWKHLAGLYKFYKVYGIKFEWIPRFNMNDMIPVPQGESLRHIFMLHDWGSTGKDSVPLNKWDIALFMDNLSTKRYPLHRSWSAFFKMRKIYPHIDSDNPNPVRLMGSGFIETARTFATQDIKVYSDDLIAAGALDVGVMIITYYIGCRFRH